MVTEPLDKMRKVIDSDDGKQINAATEMFYLNGVFSWEEYGPKHSKEDILELVKSQKGGVRKSVTHGHGLEEPGFGYFLDHSGLFLKIIDMR